MCQLHAFHGLDDRFGITHGDAPIAIEVIHVAVAIIVHENVGRITVLVPAVVGATTLADALLVVERMAEPAHHLHMAYAMTHDVELSDHQLELVEARRTSAIP